MSIDHEGFLSRDMAAIQQKARAEYAPWFDLLDRLNILCQTTLLSLKIENMDSRKVLAAATFIKILEDIQAAILLLERRAVSPARSLLRVALEAVINLASLCRYDWFHRAYELALEERRLKLAHAIRKSKSSALDVIREEFTDEIVEDIKKAAHALQSVGTKTASLEQWAKNVSMDGVYDGTYRLLSGDVHSTLDAIVKYLGVDEKGELTSFEWGPSQGRCMSGELIEAARLLIVSMTEINTLFQLAHEKELNEFLEQLRKLDRGSSRRT